MIEFFLIFYIFRDLDSRIVLAELEYSLERDQIDLMELTNQIRLIDLLEL